MSTTKSAVLCGILAAVFAIVPLGVAVAVQPAAELPLAIQSKTAILMDCDTGTVLYEKNAHQKLPMASITKIMTLVLAMEAIEEGRLKLDEPVHVSEHAASMGGSTVFLAPGETFPVSTILESIIVASANDGSVALAEKIYGSHELFVQKMNERAQQLGMKNTHFVNCTGLPAQNHYTTAYDVALMSRELLKHPLFFKWSTIWLDYMRDGKTMLVNTNKLIKFYQGCDGVKTGYTQEAGHCISATAKRGNLRLIAVILGAPTSQVRFNEASKLLDFGFANYESVQVVKKGQIVHNEIPITGGKVSRIRGVAADNLALLIKKGESKDFAKEVQVSSPLNAPIKQGQKVGILRVKREGKEVGKVDIVAGESVEVAGVFDYFNRIFNNWLKRRVTGNYK